MAEIRGAGAPNTVFVQQADAAISQADPVSTTLYEVLATTKNVRILGIACQVTWAVTQPTPLEVVVTIDGQTIIYSMVNPVTATPYAPYVAPATDIATAANQLMIAAWTAALLPIAILEGRSVRVQIRITWAVTQPTPLVCRVKYAKIP